MPAIFLSEKELLSTSFFFSLAYTVSSLMAVTFAIPFCRRVFANEENGPWNSYAPAFFHTYLELYLANAFLGEGQEGTRPLYTAMKEP